MNGSLTISLINPKYFKSIYGIALASPVSLEISWNKISASKSIETTVKTASYTFLITFGISTWVTLLTGSSMELMWSMANTLQIIYFLGLMNLYFPPHTLIIFSYLGYSNFQNPVMSFINQIMFGDSFYPNNPINNNFQELGFDSNNFVSNASDTIPAIILTIFGLLLVILLCLLMRNVNNCISRYFKKLEISMRYSSISRFGIELWLSITVISMIAVLNNDLQTLPDIVSFWMAWVALAVLTYLMIYMFIYSYFNREYIEKYPDFNERHSLIFLEFKREKTDQLFFYPYFMLRRIFISYVFVGIKDKPLVQCFCLSISSILFAKYVIKARPYTSWVNNILTVFNEVMFSWIWLTLFWFLSPDDTKALNTYGYLIDSLFIMFFIFNWSIAFPLKIYVFYIWIKEKWTKKPVENSTSNVVTLYKSNNKHTLASKRLETFRSQIADSSQVSKKHAEITIERYVPSRRFDPRYF